MKEPTNNLNPKNTALTVLGMQLNEGVKKPWLATIMLRYGEQIVRRFLQFYKRLWNQPPQVRRFIKVRLGTTVVGAALLLALSNTPTYAAIINVDGTTCTLVDAITAANTDTATGGCIAGSGADILNIAAGTITLNTALPTISSNITINGNGGIIERDNGAPNFSVLTVNSSGTFTLNDATITGSVDSGLENNGGSVTINDSTISGNAVGVSNGGDYPSTMEINNSVISGNSGSGVTNAFSRLTINDSEISGNARSGVDAGGHYSYAYGTEINNSTISGNSGNGVNSYEGPLTINGSTITGNASGGVYGSGGAGRFDVIITDSTISGNMGTGFFGAYADVTIANSTILNNSSPYDGGGINIGRNFTLTINNSTIAGNTAGSKGGGAFVYGGEVTIENSTISGNSADTGGGIDPKYSATQIFNSTITGNTASKGGGIFDYYGGAIALYNSIISGNSSPDGRELYTTYYSAGSFFIDNNVVGYDGDPGISGGATPGSTNIVPGSGIQVTDILDTTLQNNGGDTDTHALVSGSPAVDAAPTGPAADQRGVARPQGSSFDIGAFELEGVQNQPPSAEANGPYSVDEGGSVALNGSGSDPDGDPLTFEWDLDYDGVTFDVDATGPTPPFDASGLDGPNSRTVALRVTDDKGASSNVDTSEVTINNVAPTVGAISAPVDPVEVGTGINASAAFTDPGIPDTHTAQWDWGDGVIESGTVTQGAGSGSVNDSHTYTDPGVYTVVLTVTDDDSGLSTTQYQFVVVYDPNGGFVTGGGWIDSPSGAYTPDPSLTGTANFGFVSKYKKGADVPTGQTQFQFQVADLNFHSTSYDWLVVAGHKAKFKGSGTINGAGNYGFMLSAVDEKLTPSTDVDLFRIKIWDKDNGDAIVYDNQLGADDDADPTTAIQGGNIVIHKGKK